MLTEIMRVVDGPHDGGIAHTAIFGMILLF
jgi:hypothetical protein